MRINLQISLLFALSLTTSLFNALSIPLDQQLILQSFFNSTGFSNYNSTNICSTPNLKCSQFTLVVLNFSTAGLTGTIPAQLGDLTDLTYLNLNDNFLTGTIPSSLGKLHKLQQLLIRYNSFSGTVPTTLANLKNLIGLDLFSNRLEGTIPDFLSQLTELIVVGFGSNEFSGTIPSSLSALTKLNALFLRSNNLIGTIPESFGDLVNLSFLALYSNMLNGTIPMSFRNLTRLFSLDIHSNQLTGAIPDFIGDLTRLLELHMYSNELNGTIPSSMEKLTSLQYLDLTSNKLEGSIPTSLKNLTRLLEISLKSNQLQGGISLCQNGSTLKKLSVSNNKFTEFDWDNLFLCTALTVLELSNNTLRTAYFKSVPASLKTVHLEHNNISSLQLDTNFQSSLTVLSLASNNISYSINTIMPVIGTHFPFLQQLDLSNNSLKGETLFLSNNPRTWPQTLSILNLNSNKLYGKLGPFLQQLPLTINSISISENEFTGTIPKDLSHFSSLTHLQFDFNNFTGSLPIRLPGSLKVLSLKANNLTGTIPSQWGQFSQLIHINLQRNTLCGCVPPSWLNIEWLLCVLSDLHFDCNCNLPERCHKSPCNPSTKTSACGINQCTNSPCNQFRRCIPSIENDYIYGYTCTDCQLNNSVYVNKAHFDCEIALVVWIAPICIAVVVAFFVALGYLINMLINHYRINLPPSWFWDLKRIRTDYKKVSSSSVPYYKLFLEPGKKEYKLLEEFKSKLDFGELRIKKSWAVFSEDLARATYLRYLTLQRRMQHQKSTFAEMNWKVKNALFRQPVMDLFNRNCSQWDWNKDNTIEDILILPVVHATNYDIAWSIVSNGFASLHKLDLGFYGAGIYVSTSAQYTLPYLSNKSRPTILICLCLPGNPYPTIEHPKGEDSLYGKKLMAGYQSHYIRVNLAGFPYDDNSGKEYDEIVVDQESQLLPMFVLEISPHSVSTVSLSLSASYFVDKPLQVVDDRGALLSS